MAPRRALTMLRAERGMTDETRLNEHPVAGIERRDGGVVVRLVGELDLYNAPEIREALLRVCSEQPGRLVVDLAEVDFVDSTALGVLIEARSSLDNRQSFLLAAPGRETHRALTISGLDRHLSVHDTVEGALAANIPA
jgi:anti-sigma B factor antagonist